MDRNSSSGARGREANGGTRSVIDRGGRYGWRHGRRYGWAPTACDRY